MKKFLYLASLATLLASHSAQAQITPERRYSTIVAPGKLSTGDVKYAGYVPSTATSGQVRIYNANHSLYRQVAVALPTGMQVDNIEYLSDRLFNTNANLEFVLNLRQAPGNTGIVYNMLRVIDETGAQLLATDSTSYPQIYNTPSGTKMLANYYNSNVSRVFSLGGTLTALAVTPGGSLQEVRQAYPNPASAEIRLPYTLKAGQVETLTVRDATGRQIAAFRVDATFDTLLFNTSALRTGVYFYTVGTGTAQRFLVQ